MTSDAAGGRAPRRVLVAEDEPAMREVIAEVLVKDGYAVEQAADGRELLAILSSDSPGADALALIVSDVRMPGWSGLEMLGALRAARRATPVILMTAFGDDETRERAASLGARLFDKPFPLSALRDAVRELLEPVG